MKNSLYTKFSSVLLVVILIFLAPSIYTKDNPAKVYPGYDSSSGKEKLFFETNDVQSSDAIIREHLTEQFPIISEDEINNVILSKIIVENKNSNPDTSITSASETVYKVTFEVPKNYLQDTAKILWKLNIPSFESKIYQIYNGQEIYIDTWPNVVGKPSTKTYTGNYSAYRIRNWPSYKDPEPSKKDLPPTPPGPGNPLGLFVVHYDENSLRYFHGTNKNGLLKSKMRNLSHGCVRNDNGNIEKMKEFIIKRVVKSKDLSGWLNSKRTMIYDFEETDKFPVVITYKTYDMDHDDHGNYIILYKDVYNYLNPKNIDLKWDNDSLITLTTKENLISEYKIKFGNDMSEDALNAVIEYLVNNGIEYEKYYIGDLKEKFMIKN